MLGVALLAAGAVLLLIALRARKRLARVRGNYFDANGVPIHYTDTGQGDVVVLLHGFVLNADLNWRHYGIVEALAKQFRVVAVDLRGHGLSGKPDDPAAYGMEMVEDVRRLLDHLRVPRAHLVGYSTGGFITLKFLTQHSDRLLTAAATGMTYRPVDEAARATLHRIGDALQGHGDFRPLFQEIGLPTRGPIARIRMRILARLNDLQALAHVIRSFPEFEVTPEQLAANRVPTLTLAGTRDPVTQGAEQMHAIMANHALVWLDGGDKLSCLAMPEYTQALISHLRQPEMSQ